MGLRDIFSTAKPVAELQRLNRFDPFLRDSDLRAAFRALMEGDWGRLETFMESSPKAWIFSQIITSPVVGIERVNLERWVDTRQNHFARILLAGVILRDAFEMRNAATPEDIVGDITYEEDPEIIHAYDSAIAEAESMLRDVVRERPAMADPWIFLLISGRGAGVPLEELRQRFDNAHSRAPFRPDACREYLQSLTEKWGGSQTAVFDFARWLELEAPPGSPAREALPIAHIEQGLVDPTGATITGYLANPDVAEELTASLLNFLNATAVEAPTASLGALNAYALAVPPQNARAARLIEDLFERIDNRPTDYPWSLYREGITKVFGEVQNEQSRSAAQFSE